MVVGSMTGQSGRIHLGTSPVPYRIKSTSRLPLQLSESFPCRGMVTPLA